MKMESPSRFILLTIIFILLLLGAGISVASKKVKPEEIRAFITHELESQLPNAIIKTSSVDFSLGVNSVISINGLDIMLKKPRNFPLLHIDRLDFRIPFIALIFGGGKIDISARYPMIHLIKDEDFVNWSMARGNSSEVKKILIPEIFKSSEINISLFDIELVQKINSRSIRQQKVEKLIFKDIGIESPIAFEIFSKKLNFGEENSQTTLDLLMIGEIQLSKKLLDGKVGVKTSSTLTNIESKHFFKKVAKTLVVESEFELSKEAGLVGKFEISNEEMKMISSNFKYHQELLILNELTSEFLVKDLVTNLSTRFQKIFSLNNRELIKLSGDISFGEDIKSNINIASSESIILKFGKSLYPTELEGTIAEKGIVVKTKSFIGEGRVTGLFESSGKINNLFTNDSANNLSLILSDLSYEEVQVRSLFSLGENEESFFSHLGDYLQEISFNLKAKTKIENLKINEKQVSGDLEFLKTNKGFVVKSSKLKLNKGELKFSLSRILHESNDKISLDMGLDKVGTEDLGVIYNDLDVYGVTGTVSGSIKGDIQKGSYLIDSNLKFQKGILKKFSVDGILLNLDEIISDDFSIFKDGSFESLSVKMTNSTNRINVNLFEINSLSHESSLSGKGILSFDGTQENEVNISVKTKTNELGKLKFLNTTKKSAQMKLKGQGFDFKIQ